jgi:hypothetical protein
MKELIARLGSARSGGRRAGLVIAIAVVLTLVTIGTGTARASVTGFDTFDRPSLVYAVGEHMMSWDNSSDGMPDAGSVAPSNGNVGNWGEGGSPTYVGTGPSLAYVHGSSVYVEAENGGGTIYLGWGHPASSPAYSDCTTGLSSNVSPYIMTSSQDGLGTLYLLTVSTADLMQVTPVYLNTSNTSLDCGFTYGVTTTITSDSTGSGAAMAANSTTGTYWITWAGKSNGDINIAQYTLGSPTLTNKTWESNHWTLGDLSAVFDGGTGKTWIAYCGGSVLPSDSGTVYYQDFTGTAITSNEKSGGASCNLSSHDGFVSGGVAVEYDYDNYASSIDDIFLAYGTPKGGPVNVIGIHSDNDGKTPNP